MGDEARPGARMGGAVLACQTDERLLALARGGHQAAFETLVRRHRRALVAYARRVVGDDRCEDVVQTAFLKAYAAPTGAGSPVAVRAWLYRIVHNAAVDALRAHARTTTQLDDTLPGGEEPAEALERRERLREAVERLGALPARQRDAIVLQELHGRSQQEIAALFTTSEGAVRQLVHRARASLRSAAAVVLPLPLVASLARPGRAEAFASRLPDLIQGAAAATPAGTGAAMTVKVAIATIAVTGATGMGAAALPDRAADPAAAGSTRTVVIAPSVVAAPAAADPDAGDRATKRAARPRTPSSRQRDRERSVGDTNSAAGSPEARAEGRATEPAPPAGAPRDEARSGRGGRTGVNGPGSSADDDARDEMDDEPVPEDEAPDETDAPDRSAQPEQPDEDDDSDEDVEDSRAARPGGARPGPESFSSRGVMFAAGSRHSITNDKGNPLARAGRK